MNPIVLVLLAVAGALWLADRLAKWVSNWRGEEVER